MHCRHTLHRRLERECSKPVTNSGFESPPDFTGWTHAGDTNGFDGVGMDSAFAHSGMHYAYLGSTPDNGSLSQSLSTMAGQSYSLSFWLANDITAGLPAGNYFEVFWNGVSVFSLTNSGAFDYTQFGALNLMATGATSTLEFRYRHDNDFWRLDDVYVSEFPNRSRRFGWRCRLLAPWVCCIFPALEAGRAWLISKRFR